MASIHTVWGIDVGRYALKALKLRSTGEDQIEVVAYDFVEHSKILSQPDADRHELIAEALEKFLSRNDITKDQVVIGVPGQHTLARFTKLPPVAPKRIPDIVRYEADQQIPFDMDEVIWDYHTFQQEGLPDLEVGIFAMKKELVREHLLHLEQAAIEPIGVQSGPLAIYNAAHFDGLLEVDTSILLDIGAENTDLVIGTANSLWTRTIPIGGNNFTEALVKAFKLSFAKAESLKRTAATSKYARQIFQAMRPIFADLVQELQRSMGFYSSTHRDAKIEKVFGMGNAFQLPGLQKYLQQNLGLVVETPSSFVKVTESVGNPEVLREQRLGFFVAYGLALQGLGVTKITSNLLPTEMAKQVVWRKKRPAFAAAAACLVVAGAIIWFRQTSDMSALAAGTKAVAATTVSPAQATGIIESGPAGSLHPRAQAKSIYDAGSALKKELDSKKGKGDKERSQVEKLVKLQNNRTVIPAITKVIHDSLPVPDGAAGEARTAADYRSAVVGNAGSRAQRAQVFLESFKMTYEQNVNDVEWRGQLDPPEPINDPKKKIPAIKVVLNCTSPHQGGPTFVNESFIKPLRNNGRKAKTGFYFDRVILFDGKKAVATKAGAPGRTPTAPAPSAGGRTPGAPAPATGLPPSALDPVTGEPSTDDWEYTIWIDVILDDCPDEHVVEG